MRKFRQKFATLVIKSSPAIAFLVGTQYVVLVLLDTRRDTTTITNAAFGITAVLASLSFSCARALQDGDKDRDRFTYAGERFLHACIFLIVASLLKYTTVRLQQTGFSQAHVTTTRLLVLPVGIFVAALFLNALFSAHTGLRVCGDLLLVRLDRYEDYNTLL